MCFCRQTSSSQMKYIHSFRLNVACHWAQSLPTVSVQWLALLLHIREVPEAGYIDRGLLQFSSVSPCKSLVVPLNRTRPFCYTPFPIHHPLIRRFIMFAVRKRRWLNKLKQESRLHINLGYSVTIFFPKIHFNIVLPFFPQSHRLLQYKKCPFQCCVQFSSSYMSGLS